MTLNQILSDFEDYPKKYKRFLRRLFNRKRSLRSIFRDMVFTKQLKLIGPNYS